MPKKGPKGPAGGGSDGGGGGEEPVTGIFINGTPNSDRLTGGGGDDKIRGGAGDDKINGRDGFDVAVYDGSINDFDLRAGSRGIWYVTDENAADGDEGRDELKSIEQLQFNDFVFNLNGDNPAVITAPETTVYAVAGETVTFEISAYDVDDSIALQLYDRTEAYDHVTVAQPYWAVERLGETGRSIGATVTIKQNGSADAMGLSDFSRGYLAEGETETQTLSFRAGTSSSGWTYQDIDVVYVGVNDDPTLAAISDMSVVEDGGAVSLDLAQFGDDIDSDDTGATLTYTILSAPENLAVSIAGCALTIDPGAGFQNLSADEFIDFTVEVQATDRHGAATEIREIAIRLNGSDDPLTLYNTPDGKPDYAALGANPFATPSLGVLNGLSDDPAYLTLFGFTDGADTLVLQADDLVHFQTDDFFYRGQGTTNYQSLPIDTGSGDDTLLIALTGDAVEFKFNDILTGEGRDVVAIDVQTPFGIESFSNTISTGANDDQVLINIETAGVIQFAANNVNTGSGNDVVHVNVQSTREDGGPSALAPFSDNDFNLGSGNDRLTIDLETANGIDVGIDGTINAGAGEDIIDISNAGSTLSSDAFSSFRTLGLYSDVYLGEGDDVLILDVLAFDGEGATAQIYGGSYFGVEETGFDTVILETGNIADFNVTNTGDSDWIIEQGGQTLNLYGIEEIVALDGSISDFFM